MASGTRKKLKNNYRIKINDDEVFHHINIDGSDDRLENIVIVSKTLHYKIHSNLNKLLIEMKLMKKTHKNKNRKWVYKNKQKIIDLINLNVICFNLDHPTFYFINTSSVFYRYYHK